jgi:hypothetical protein
MQPTPDYKSSWLDDRIANLPKITWEMVIFAVLLFAAVFTRFYDLESRVMSHDESLHTYYSWKLSTEGQYVHDPMMHGPFQFHVVSLAYTLLGDSDFSARVPAVLFGILSIAFLWAYRQYLGTLGVILAGVIFVISPYMLYYARYVRNESFVVLFGLVGMWSLLRYLDTGKSRYLLWLTASTALHFSTKETAFIYTAQMLIFLGLLFLQRVINQKWSSKLYRTLFLIMVVIAVVMFGIAIWEVMFATGGESTGTPTVVQPAIPDQSAESPTLLQTPTFIAVMEGGLGLVATILGLFFLVRGIGLESLRKERSFGLILLLLTLILPQLTPLPVRFMGWPVPDTPGALQTMTLTEVLHFVIFLVPLVLVSVGIGVWWNRKVWLINAAVFYAIFTYLYTTGFTNPSGFLSGLVGSLGYWMAQQAVQRGSQPWYFYLLIQLPIYEYLAAFGSLTAIVIFTWRRLRQYISSEDHVLPEEIREEQESAPTQNDPPSANPQTEAETVNVLPEQSSETLALYLLIFWTISSFLAYTVAGEKMPWLTVHIALPMILLAGWGFAQVIHGIPWQEWRSSRGGLTLVILIVFVLSLFGGLGVLLGGNPPFQSRMQADLQITTRFLSILVILGLSGWGLFRLIANWKTAQIARMGFLILAGLGVLLTLRTSLPGQLCQLRPGQ